MVKYVALIREAFERLRVSKKYRKKLKKVFKKVLTNANDCDIIYESSRESAHGSIAQLGEHLPYKQRVIGSSPIVPTIRGPVVQLVRTLACHARGQGFESPSGRQQNTARAVCLCSSVGRAED